MNRGELKVRKLVLFLHASLDGFSDDDISHSVIASHQQRKMSNCKGGTCQNYTR